MRCVRGREWVPMLTSAMRYGGATLNSPAGSPISAASTRSGISGAGFAPGK